MPLDLLAILLGFPPPPTFYKSEKGSDDLNPSVLLILPKMGSTIFLIYQSFWGMWN